MSAISSTLLRTDRLSVFQSEWSKSPKSGDGAEDLSERLLVVLDMFTTLAFSIVMGLSV